MTITEKNMDLFTVPQGHYLAHCISADFALGAGIAKVFNDVFNMREKLKEFYSWPDVGDCLPVDNVFNLVTKELAFQKPTIDSLGESLQCMKRQMLALKIKKLAMPKIGCGLDKLDWEEVKDVIETVFDDTDIEILVCVI